MTKRHIMTSKKVLFISQAIEPYVPATAMSELGRKIPQAIQEMGNEIRTFLPKWGNINERRNQLHEVIRLSGLNVIIDDTDHPLIIKVASLQSAHMQVYFIDNEDFFQKRLMEGDKDGVEYTDNYERAIFYARSVLETIKKLRWYPDIIHCQGWIAGMAPFYIKTAYKEDPPFANAKVVYSLHGSTLHNPMPDNFKDCMAFRNVTAKDIDKFGLEYKTPDDFAKLAMNFSDGVIAAEEAAPEMLLDFARSKNIPVLDYEQSEDTAQRYADFYETLF